MTDYRREGGCRCGRLRIRVSAPPLLASACHCTGCQRMTGSAFSLTATFPGDAFAVIAGDPVIGGLHGPDTHHFHCDRCKSWVFTRVDPDLGFVNVRTTMLDDPGGLDPFVETFTSEKLPWATTPAVHSFATAPAIEDYAPLVDAFVRR